ncbi:MAG: bifunctional phosphopantothenoylcysteine decarboxylase/phosphopantothenate--cysteine ligase CoaBC [Pseudomonadota bacterium]
MSHSVLLGVSGGIAAYKAPLLVRLLVQSGKNVTVVLTDAATQFVTPLTLATLSGNPVYKDMWVEPYTPGVEHIELADRADVAVIAPATADILGKIAGGIADDLLTTVMMAVDCPVLLCPAMNVKMFHNPIVQENIHKLRSVGYTVMDPDAGYLACGWTGEGRMPEPEAIAAAVDGLLEVKDLAGLRILVTAGPTEEPLDPVRFLTNRSSGKMGVAVAKRAAARGADVTMVSGPLKVRPPFGVRHHQVRTALEMYDRVLGLADGMDVVIKTAAVADFRPAAMSTEKIKKTDAAMTINLVRNPDILLALGERKRDGQVLVGFAAETDDILKNAREKLRSKNLDMLVLNDVTRPGAGFDCDTNIVRFLNRNGDEEQMEIMTKEKVADLILDRVKTLRGTTQKG